MRNTILFTKQGYEEIQKEYQVLLASRPEAVKELAKAREMGDLSENGYYKAARMKLSGIDRRIRQVKHLLKTATIYSSTSVGTIDIGSVVTLFDGSNKKSYQIVGTYESNPSLGRISYLSPLGALLMGKRGGDTVVLQVEGNQKQYIIQAIN